MVIHRFKSNYFEHGHGFKLEYESTEITQWSYGSGVCGGNFTTLNGLITSPSFPNKYPINSDCRYIISQPNGAVINIIFSKLDTEYVEYDFGCSYDYLEIRDGNSPTSPMLGRFCGNRNEIPAPIQSSQNVLYIR